jgi:hypothetical protein
MMPKYEEGRCPKFGTLPNFDFAFWAQNRHRGKNSALDEQVEHALEYRDALQDAA